MTSKRAKWTTKSGFKYPAPKTREEYLKLPNDVSESRKEALKQPWDEFALRPKPKRERRSDDTRPEFNTLPATGL